MAEARAIPRNGLICMAAACVAAAACELLVWSHRSGLGPLDYGLFRGLALVWIGLSYLVPMQMLDRRVSVGSFLRFIAASFALAFPLLIGIACLIAALRIGLAFGLLGVILLICAFVTMPMLAGWPLLQANSRRFVSPYWALKATRGIRWSLLAISFALGGMGRLVPATGTVDDIAPALALAALGAAVSFVTAMIGFGMAVVAYKHMAPAFPESII